MSSSLILERKEECGILSCKNDDKHLYNKRNEGTAMQLNLLELKMSDRETEKYHVKLIINVHHATLQLPHSRRRAFWLCFCL